MLQTWEAARLEEIKSGGRTQPLIFNCVMETAELFNQTNTNPLGHCLMLVKAVGLPEITETRLFCEVFGNLLCREIGITTALPALINLSPRLVEHLNTRYNFNLQAGIGAGCEYLKGLTGISPGAPLNSDEAQQAVLIYGFDLLTQNPDRRVDNPNCALKSGRLIAYDFEFCFSFVQAIGKQPSPWKVSQHQWAKKHVLRSNLQSRTVDWQPLLQAVDHLSKERLEQLTTWLPEKWQECSGKIVEHLLRVKANLSKFEIELQRSLL